MILRSLWRDLGMGFKFDDALTGGSPFIKSSSIGVSSTCMSSLYP